jgi:Na+/proline symporter
MMDVFNQLKLTWDFPVIFAAPFWLGILWRRANTTAAWSTVLFGLAVFLVLPQFAVFSDPLWMYNRVGIDTTTWSHADTSPPSMALKIVLPFVVMIVVSLLTRPNSAVGLDRYYAKMRTPVVRDRVEDSRRVESAQANPAGTERKKLLPGSSLEICRPTPIDVIGFVVSLAACGAIIALAWAVVSIGR